MFQMISIGPMGQAMYFQRIAEPQGYRDEYAIERYVRESLRLLEVVDKQLAGKAYILGDDYSIVDMAMCPWARAHFWAKAPIDGLSNLRSWLQNLERRPAIMRAMQLPEPFPAFFGEGDVAAAENLNSKRFSD
jgi:GST-like protein